MTLMVTYQVQHVKLGPHFTFLVAEPLTSKVQIPATPNKIFARTRSSLGNVFKYRSWFSNICAG